MRPRREPERTCVGCRGKAGKGSLLRIARGADGSVRIDRSGDAPGRGAYVHQRRDCVDAAFATGALSRALRMGSAMRGAARLREDIEGESLA